MNDNKTIKVLRIITLTLSLMLLVFALAKKVGLCASGGQSVVTFIDFPLPYGFGAGYDSSLNLSDSIFQELLNKANTPSVVSGTDGLYDTVLMREYDSTNNFVTFYVTHWNKMSFSLQSGKTDFPFYNMSSSDMRNRQFRLDLNTGVITYINYQTTFTTNISTRWVDSSADNKFVLKSGNLINYPLYTTVTDSSFTDYFASGHSQGGSLTSYSDDVQEFIDEHVNDLDTSDPVDTSSIPSWLKSILGGLGTINNTIGGGFNWVKKGINNIWGAITDFSDNVTGFFEDLFDSITGGVSSIVGKLDDVITSIEGNSGDYETVADAWIDCYDNSLIYDFISEFSVVDASFKSLANTSPASSVSFSLGLPSWNVPNVSGSGSSNILANHNSISFNFDWYTVPRYSNGDSIRDRIWLVFIPFILFGFMWRLLSKIPSILGGNSGLSEGVHKTIEVSNIYANKTN